MSRTIITAEIGFKNVTVSPQTTGTIYVASEGFVSKATDFYPNVYFEGRLDGEVGYKVKLSTGFWGGDSSVGVGAVEVINDDGGIDGWLNLEFRDKTIVLKEHTAGASYDDATVLLNAIIERMDVVSEKRMRFVIRDPIAPLVKPMTTDVFSGNDADGVLKPIAFGQPELCRPVLVDEDNLEYHVNDTTLQSIVAVYDQGVTVDFNPVANGFRLITAPSGKVTATVLSSGTGEDPTLTVSDTEYKISGEGRSIEMFDDGLSPEVSLNYATTDAIDASKASSGGGKYYFEMYIDSLNEPTSTLSPAVWDGVAFDVAVGIASAAISNPQTPKAAGFYMLSVGAQYAGAAIGAEYNTYINDTATDSIDYLSHNAVGETIGVKVDFDAMTIDFLRNNTNEYSATSPATKLTGPFSIAAGTYSPVITASDKTKDAICSIRLIEDDFVYALPSGYSAWSTGITADSTFSKFTQSITDRLSGVTFDSASVTTIDGLVHSSPETAYTYSYYLDKSYTASKLLTDCMTGIGGYWFVNRLGNVQVGQLTAPGSAVRTIDDVQILRDIEIRPDNAKGLSNGLGALRNWSPYRESEVSGSATEVFKQQITREYQSEYRSTTTMAGPYDHADGAPMPVSLLSSAAAASQEADRWAALYAKARRFYDVEIALNSVDYSDILDEIGQTYTLETDRYGLSDGLNAVLVGVDAQFLTNKLTLTLWGDAPVVSADAPPTYDPSIDDPTDIDNLALWLDGSDYTSMYSNAGSQPFGLGTSQISDINGSQVGCWADKSGNGNHMNQPNTGRRPEYRTGVQNGLSAMLSPSTDNSNPYMFYATSSVLSQDQEVTIFAVTKMISDEDQGGVYSNANTDSKEILMRLDSRNTFRSWGSVTDSSGSANSSMPADIGTEANQLTCLITSAQIQSRLNGVAGSAANKTGDGVTVNDYTRIFTQTGPWANLNGYICELVIYDAELTAAQIEAVETYLKDKWATP